MSENLLDIAIKNFYINKHNSDSYIDILISSPSPVQKRTLGKLIIITKIDSKVQTKTLPNIINENIRSNYYSNINANIEFSLESTILDFNKKIKEIEKIEKIKDLEKFMSSIVIVLKDNSIYFTQHGSISTILMHKDKIVDIGEDIEKDGPIKMFSDIVIGKINKKNTIVFCTSNLFGFIDKEKISNHLNNSNIENTTEFIKKSLDAQDDTIDSSLGFVFIGENKEPSESEVIYEDESPKSTGHSNIIENAQEIINTSFAKNGLNFFKKTFSDTKNKVGEFFKSKQFDNFVKDVQKNSKDTMNKLADVSKKSVKEISKKTKEISDDLKNESLQDKLKRKQKEIIEWFKNLNLTKKVALFSLIGFIFLSIIGFRMWQYNESVRIEKIKYEESVQNIKNTHNEASSALIYNNTDKAKQLIEDAKYLIGKLDIGSGTRKQTQETLLQDNLNILNNVYKITTITNPKVLFDFSTLKISNPNINLDRIISYKNNFYAFDFKDKGIYSVNNEGAKELGLSKNLPIFNNLVISPTEDGNLVLLDEAGNINIFDGDKITNVDLKDKLKGDSVIDINSFGKSLYFLEVNKNQILSLRKGSRGYTTAPASWLSTAWSLKDSVSIAIDGSVYIAKSNGLIEKFLRGYNKSFTMPDISPKLENINRIFTNEDTDYIYVLDNKGKRLIVINKNNGSLVNQYISDSFANAKDLVVDKNNGKVYISDDLKIYEISF